MQTIASIREYINEYVRTLPIDKVGNILLKEHFGIPYEHCTVNHVLMTETEVRDYIKSFFENLDTTAIIELYNKIKV